MAAITYKTHQLIGILHVGGFSVLRTWDYIPTGKDVEEAKAAASKSYDGFFLVTPVGEVLDGNYVPSSSYDGYCGL